MGFGSPANLFLYSELGYEVHGMEVERSILDLAADAARENGHDVSLELITSPALPYPQDHFDVIISWNAVYYFGTRTLVAAALREFHRCLAPDGGALLSVIHPNSFMVSRLSRDLGDGRYRIDRESPHDNRLNSEIFFEPSSTGWRALLSDFDEIEEGYVEFDLFDPWRRNARRLFLARKKRNP